MKDEIRKIIEKGLKNYRNKSIKISDKEYNLAIFSEDEDLNLFDGFLFAEAKEKSDWSYFRTGYRTPVSGYAPRLGLILFNEQLLIKDYRKLDKQILKNLSKINKTFLAKIEKALSQPSEENFIKLFDRTDIIEEFYILYKKAREYLLTNIKGIPEEGRKEEFVDNFMMQMLTLWYLQERGFFNNDTSYLITKFKELKQKKLTGGFDSYYDFLGYFFDKICNNLDSQYYEDKIIGKVVVVGPAIFLNGEHDSEAISIADKCFYKEGLTDSLINTAPKKVSDEVPLLNLFESRDWTEGNIDEYVLGAIYEKLITYMERKKLGAHYTPEEITSNICKNTIEPYLVDRINEKFGKNFETINQIIEANDRNILFYLFEQLREIKILDPAVGSAHFLESTINVILDIYEKIWEKAKDLGLRKGLEIVAADEKGKIKSIELLDISDEKQFNLYIKFFIILSKNIYGVDINPSALKVAKARLFLTLAKHFDVNKNFFIRFPNVHFNLRTGNSLIGYVQLEKEKIKGQATLDFFVKEEEDPVYVTKSSLLVVSDLKGYLTETSKALNLYGNILKEIEELNFILSKKSIEWLDFETVLRTKEKLIKILIVSLNSQYAEPINKLLNNISQLFNKHLDKKFAEAHKIDLEKLNQIKTMHWIFEFPEVFLERGGFDVVIGNPPYVRADTDDETFITQRTVIENLGIYKTLYEKWDLFIPFIERSIRELLNKWGKFSFIVSDALCTVKYSEKMREWLAQNYFIPSIDYFEGFQVFVGVGIVPIVFFIDKSRPPGKTRKIIHVGSFDNIPKKMLVEQNSPDLFKKTKGDILDFNYENSEKLGDICYISYGLRPNADEKTAKGDFGKEELISDIPTVVHSKKYIEGKDVKRYQIETIRYLEWGTERCPNGIARKTFPELYDGNKILRGTIVDGVLDSDNLICNHSLIVFKRFTDLKGVNNQSIQGSIKKQNKLPRAKLEELSKKYSYEYLLAIMNSSFAKRYLNAVRRHKLKNYFYPDDFRKLPIKKSKKQDIFINLVKILQFLYTRNSQMTEFLDNQVLNTLVYELYFSEKFTSDGLKVIFSDIVTKHIKSINYDRWAELYWKKQLEEKITSEEEKDLETLEKENISTIEKIYSALIKDKEVQAQIENIKAHEWVKVVEAEK